MKNLWQLLLTTTCKCSSVGTWSRCTVLSATSSCTTAIYVPYICDFHCETNLSWQSSSCLPLIRFRPYLPLSPSLFYSPLPLLFPHTTLPKDVLNIIAAGEGSEGKCAGDKVRDTECPMPCEYSLTCC